MTINDLLKSYQDIMPEPADHAALIRLQAPDSPETISFKFARRDDWERFNQATAIRFNPESIADTRLIRRRFLFREMSFGQALIRCLRG